MINQIQSHQFLRLVGKPCPPKEHHKGDGPIHRKGVDGSGFVAIGRWGDPFSLESFVDQLSIQEAWTTFHEYRDLIDLGAVLFIQDDHDFTLNGWEIKVLDVEPTEVREQICFTGGLSIPDGDSGASLRCRWTVCAVEIV